MGSTAGQPSSCDHGFAHPHAGRIWMLVTGDDRAGTFPGLASRAMLPPRPWATELDSPRAMAKVVCLLTTPQDPWGALWQEKRDGDTGLEPGGSAQSGGPKLSLCPDHSAAPVRTAFPDPRHGHRTLTKQMLACLCSILQMKKPVKSSPEPVISSSVLTD